MDSNSQLTYGYGNKLDMNTRAGYIDCRDKFENPSDFYLSQTGHAKESSL